MHCSKSRSTTVRDINTMLLTYFLGRISTEVVYLKGAVLQEFKFPIAIYPKSSISPEAERSGI